MSPAAASAWRPASESSAGTADASGWTHKRVTVRRSISPCRRRDVGPSGVVLRLIFFDILSVLGTPFQQWGAHGEQTDPRAPLQHPHSRPDPQVNIGGGGGDSPIYVRRGPMSDADIGFSLIVTAFVSMLFMFPVWICVYPFAALTGTVAGFLVVWFSTPFFLRMDPTAGSVAFVCGVLAAIVVAYTFCRRVEQRLEHVPAYTIPRHLLRTFLFGVLMLRSLAEVNFLPHPGEPWLPFHALAADHAKLAVFIVAMVLVQLALLRDGFPRRFWHGYMRCLFLRRA